MRLVADENINRLVVQHLRKAGHEIVAIAEDHATISDESVLDIANERQSILLTSDKDFGELAYRQNLVHCGIILVRLAGQTTEQKSIILEKVLNTHGDELRNSFTVITSDQVRIRKPQ
jgi:predicted nuclease of predicted toxin-antitoxin system